VRVKVIATGFEQSRAARKVEQPAFRPRPQVQQNAAPAPAQPRREEQEVPLAPPQQQAPAPQRPAPQQDNFAARVYDEDNIDIPTFLRKRK
jgi:hypothetical protein